MKNYGLEVLFYVALAIGILAPSLFPPELSNIFNSLFWSAAGLFVCSCFVVGYLYVHGGSTQRVHFVFGLLLIVSAAFMYSGFEQISSQAAYWEPFMKDEYPILFILFQQLIGYTKNIIAFGFAALGASIAANVISNRFASRQAGPPTHTDSE